MKDKITTQPLIGIITVLYNSDNVLEDFFYSLSLENNINFKLYVIDNSDENSGTILAQELASKLNINIQVLFNNKNNGVAKGNNQGIQLALDDGCDLILLSNNDITFKRGTISKLIYSLQEEGIYAATPKIYYHNSNNVIWYAGGNIDLKRILCIHRGMDERDYGQYDNRCITNYAPTCFMLVKAEVFSRIGLMDEQYFVYYDDTDFVFRMHQSNMNIIYVPESLIEHKVSNSTGGNLSPFTLYYINRNRIYFTRKNSSFINKILSIIYISITRVLYIIKYPRKVNEKIILGFIAGFKMDTKLSK